MKKLVIEYQRMDIDGAPTGITSSNIEEGQPYFDACARLMEAYTDLMEERNKSRPGLSGKLEIDLEEL